MSKDAPISPQTLPDDPAVLKQMVIEMAERQGKRVEQIAALEQQEVVMAHRVAALEAQRSEYETQLAAREHQKAELEKLLAAVEEKNLLLQHRLDLALRRYYGPHADRVDPAQLVLEFATALEQRPVDPPESPAESATSPDTNPSSARRIGRGRRDLSTFNHLPVTRKVHDLPDDKKACPSCGTRRARIGEETSWQIEYVPASFTRIEHVRVKYACGMCELQGNNPNIVVTPQPAAKDGGPGGIKKGMAGPGLLAYVVTSKFADYLPLYRLQNIFERNGLELDRSTMSIWCGDVADILEPIYKRMVHRVLQSHVIATDDTAMPMQCPGDPECAGKTRTARMWVYAGDEDHPDNVFDFTISRSRDGPAQFLGAFKGTLLADAYGGYEGICVEKSMAQAGCWSHGRRKFVDAQSLEPAITGEALQLIGRLFDIESQARALSHADRLSVRQKQSKPVLDTLHSRLLSWQAKLLPKHPVAQAVGYAINQWQPLTTFVGDGAVPLDNNMAEREMKRQALNRKNSLFVGNERGGRTAAILSSITSTCRRHEVDPQRYITQLLVNLPTVPPSELDAWLPDRWKRTQAELSEFK